MRPAPRKTSEAAVDPAKPKRYEPQLAKPKEPDARHLDEDGYIDWKKFDQDSGKAIPSRAAEVETKPPRGFNQGPMNTSRSTFTRPEKRSSQVDAQAPKSKEHAPPLPGFSAADLDEDGYIIHKPIPDSGHAAPAP